MFLGLLTIAIILCIVIAGVVSDKQPQKTAPALTPVSPEATEKQALALQDRGEYAAAEDFFRKCVSERQKVLGIEHEYSLLRKSQRRDIEARRLAFQLMAGARRTLPPHHPDRVKYEQLLESLR